MFDSKLLKILEEVIRDEAAERASDAGHSGAHHDGGSRALLRELDAFLSGYKHTLPPSWNAYYAQAHRRNEIAELANDPDYITYQGLKKKFKHLEDK